MRRSLVCCILLVTMNLTLAACGAAAQGPMTWLDRPLDGAVLPLAPVTIQAHASDADGVASFQFFVDDAPLVTTSAEGGRLGTATVEWNPTAPGTYTIRARGVDSQGNAGSDATSVVTVGELTQASPTPSLAPEATPPGPSAEVQIDFTADRTNLMPGECALLLWSVEGGEVVHLDGEPVAPSGEREVCPEETTPYTLAVHVGVGPPSPPVAERELVIIVGEPRAMTPSPTYAVPTTTARPTATTARPTATSVPPASTPTTPPPPPTIVSIRANPSSITQGQCTTVSWAVEGVISAVYFDGEGVGDHDSRQRCPAQSTTYDLRAVGPGGEDTANVAVTVTQPQPTQTQPFSADLAITDLRPEPPSQEVHGDITNHGPGSVVNVTVQLYCEWEQTDPIEGTVIDSGQTGAMPILISSLSPGQSQEFNTDVSVQPAQFDYDMTCTIQVPFNDPNTGNNSYSESF